MNPLIIYTLPTAIGTFFCFHIWKTYQEKNFFWLGWVGIGFIVIDIIKYVVRAFYSAPASFEIWAYVVSSILLLIALVIITKILVDRARKH